ncbi:MAG TPA: carbohydrate-binding family 9-like protein, partial [Edaphobacter sp.]|nr:carbohydrate-binding family 9-like protein [Edaphobacter sp.]
AATVSSTSEKGSYVPTAAARENALGLTNQAEADGMPNSTRASWVIVSESSDVDVVPDGNLGKKMWSTAKRIRFDQAAFSRRTYPKEETVVASRWTTKYLYLAFWCHYQSLNTYEGEDAGAERWQLWERDVVEAFINPQPERPSHYYEFEVAPNNQWLDLDIDLKRLPFNDPKWNSGFEHATRIDSVRHLWTVEMRIPVVSMTNEGVRPNAEWRINFYRCDGPGAGRSRRMLSWGPLPLNLPRNSFHQPASFGVLRFSIPGKSTSR